MLKELREIPNPTLRERLERVIVYPPLLIKKQVMTLWFMLYDAMCHRSEVQSTVYKERFTSTSSLFRRMSIRLTNFVFFSRMQQTPIEPPPTGYINFNFRRRKPTHILCLRDLADRAKLHYASHNISLKEPCPSMLVIKTHNKGQTVVILPAESYG